VYNLLYPSKRGLKHRKSLRRDIILISNRTRTGEIYPIFLIEKYKKILILKTRCIILEKNQTYGRNLQSATI